MLGAAIKVKLALGFLSNGQMAGYELDLVFLIMALFIAVNGSKLYSLDQVLLKGQEQPS